MRILYAKLVGYIGIYNGLGKTEIEIDFTRSKNHICVISGPNGCGKSTILNALNILPDDNICFVPSMQASKDIRILDEDVVYDIHILHPIDNKNNRATTKAYIQKNGIELNENGNVSSYKDIIFNQFDLDNNYITLSHLSGDDRGLADKKPAERKKFIASISSSLDVYNDIHKNLNKKANTYKSYLNSLTGKIRMIGDESNLRSTLVSLKNREEKISNEIEKLKAEVIQNNTVISMNDPDGQLQQRYISVEADLKECEEDSTQAFTFLRNFYESHFDQKELELDKDAIEKHITDTTEQLQTHKEDYAKHNTDIVVSTNLIQTINDNISKDSIKINKLSNEVDLQLDKAIAKYEKSINQIVEEFKQLEIGDIDNISSGEINQAINVVNDFINGIDILYEGISIDELQELVKIYRSNQTISQLIQNYTEQIDIEKEDITNITNQLLNYKNDLAIISELDNRPKECKIDSCYFIQRQLQTLEKNTSKKSLQKKINQNEELIQYKRENIKKNEELIERYKILSSKEAILDRLRILLDSNKAIISKIGVLTLLSDFNALLGLISKNNNFNQFRDISLLQNASNDIIEYKNISGTYNVLLSKREINDNRIKELNEYQNDIDKQRNDLENETNKRSKLMKEFDFISNIIDNLNQKSRQLNDLLTYYNDWVTKDNTYQKMKLEYENLQKQFKGSVDILKSISEDSEKILSLQKELEPITDQKKNIDSQLLLLDSYDKEYQEYSEKYEIVNTLKKYSSPTAGGIQTLFMSMYMGQTLDLANQLLGMIFQGQYRLLDYVINENEFRMPFIGNGLSVDDISSGSTSQVCIMGMIINLTLLNQASTKYNITRLDEIDGGLDHSNRYLFVDILQKIIQILNIDQLFIISHSAESALSNVDVIQLAPIPDYEDVFTGANIIYSYKDNG